MDALNAIKNLNEEELVNCAMKYADGMSRQQKRQYKREITEDIETMKSFNAKQMQFIARFTHSRAMEDAQDQILRYIAIVDSCINAYINLRFEDLTCEEVAKEAEYVNELIVEYKEMLNKLISENKGDEVMASKQLEKMTNNLEEKCREIAREGKNQKEALVILQHQYPTISKSLLVNTYKKVKSRVKAEEGEKEKSIKELHEADKAQEEKEIEDAVNYIFEDEVEEVEEVKEEEENMNKGLKVKSKKVIATIEGEFGEYLFEDGVVTINDKKFSSLVDVDNYEKAELAKLNAKFDELKAVMGGVF